MVKKSIPLHSKEKKMLNAISEYFDVCPQSYYCNILTEEGHFIEVILQPSNPNEL